MITEFKVSGMHCDSCKNLIEEEVGEMSGVRSVRVDLPGKQAIVDYDEEAVSPKMLIQQIAELGYQAEVALSISKGRK